MLIGLYFVDSFPGESRMLAALAEIVDWNREACRVQDERPVCWLYPEEIELQRRKPVSR